MTKGVRPLTATVGVATMFALAGCAPGQMLGPDCPLVDFDVVLSVTVESELDIDDVGICDENGCTTDSDIDTQSEVHGVYTVYDDEDTWAFTVIHWMPDSARFVAIAGEEEIDLGWHDLEIAHNPIVEGGDCGSIPSYEPLTIRA